MLTPTEYSNLMLEITRISNLDEKDQLNRHSKKLLRDQENGKCYIQWQTYADRKKARSRRFKFKKKKKAPRIPSRRAKRKKLKLKNEQSAPINKTEPPPVINLSSSVTLTEGHYGIFRKGPKFVPNPPKANFAEFNQDYELWKSKMRWAYYHTHKPETVNLTPPLNVAESNIEEIPEHALQTEKSLIKMKSSGYIAPKSKNHALELFFHKLDIAVKDSTEKKGGGDNLTPAERLALNEMKRWDKQIVRPYDKGTGFVVDDLDNYKQRVLTEIQNTQGYKIVDNEKDAIQEIHERIEKWKQTHNKELSPLLMDWLIDSNAIFGYIYMNYKAHKPEKQYPGRFITSGCGSPTERLSIWIEHHLKPLMSKVPYRLEDTSQFLRDLEEFNHKRSHEENPPQLILCTWDIESMYPSIDYEQGLNACRALLKKRQSEEPSTESLVEAIKLCLEENIAEFDGTVVKQISGTAMGPHHSCSYADIAIDQIIDQNVMSSINPWYDKIALWRRFRDDIICFWIGSEEENDLFDIWLNNLQKKLRFTKERSIIKSIYLDLKLLIKGIFVTSEMYSKSSDSHAYLLPSSCHPTHICRNIPI